MKFKLLSKYDCFVNPSAVTSNYFTLCHDEMFKLFPQLKYSQAIEITAKQKNPKKKGYVKVSQVPSRRVLLKLKRQEVLINLGTHMVIESYFKSPFWVKIDATNP